MPEPATQCLYLDVDLLAQVIRDFNDAAWGAGVFPDARIQAKLIALLYERIARSGGKIDRGLIEKYLKLTNGHGCKRDGALLPTDR
ncbi:MAG: hypothetical protein K9K88_04985 [Desulfobacterales bacterium]|nr:hypothetical protein [Desulfobacterales bacterium]